MQIKTENGWQNVASSGVAGSGLGLGIAGTVLGLMNGGGLNLFGGWNRACGCGYVENPNIVSALYGELGKEKAEKYADNVGIGVYNAVVADYKELRNFISQLDKEIAVEKQATRDNFAFLNNKIDTSKRELFGYVNSHFVQGKLVMPLESVEPQPMRRFNSYVAPTEPADEEGTTPTT